MKWIRHEEGFKVIYHGMTITLVFLILSMLYAQTLLAANFAAVFAMFSFQNFYYTKVGKELIVLTPTTRQRYLIGSRSNLVFEFQNGRIPIWNGTLTLFIQDAVAPANEVAEHFSGIFEVTVPFAIGSGEKVGISIPLEGRKRGVARITRLTIDVPHLFGDGSVLMELDEPILQENVVYPRIVRFEENLLPSPYRPGEVEQRTSLFQDAFQPVGTRDYVPTDRFDQIHWSASARMQKLQTKEFLPVSALSVLFLLNAIEKPRSPGDFEYKVERLASYADYCTRHGIPYSIAINVRTFGNQPFLYNPTGSGKLHYQTTLEMLARISEKNAMLPYWDLLQSVDRRGILPPTIVLITHDPESVRGIAKKWSQANHVVTDSFYEGRGDEWETNGWKKTGTD